MDGGQQMVACHHHHLWGGGSRREGGEGWGGGANMLLIIFLRSAARSDLWRSQCRGHVSSYSVSPTGVCNAVGHRPSHLHRILPFILSSTAPSAPRLGTRSGRGVGGQPHRVGGGHKGSDGGATVGAHGARQDKQPREDEITLDGGTQHAASLQAEEREWEGGVFFRGVLHCPLSAQTQGNNNERPNEGRGRGRRKGSGWDDCPPRDLGGGGHLEDLVAEGNDASALAGIV